MGYCAPRLCPPDRVFVPATQLCHYPQDATICPIGRELYYSAFGTPICSCPDGSVERGEDLDDVVCEPILGPSIQCLPGQVFWFKDFQSPPQCLPDPCNGDNLNRGPDTLPFIPSAKGQCYRLGQSEGVCPNGTFYALSLGDLVGECTSLEDAGYNIFDPKELQELTKTFGDIISENNAPPIKETELEITKNNNTKTSSFGLGVTEIANTVNTYPNMQTPGNFDHVNKQPHQIVTPNIFTSQNISPVTTSQAVSMQHNNHKIASTNQGIDLNKNLNKNQQFVPGSMNQQMNQNSFIQGISQTGTQSSVDPQSLPNYPTHQNNQGNLHQQNMQTQTTQQTIQQSNQTPLQQQNMQSQTTLQNNQGLFNQQTTQSHTTHQINQRPFQTPNLQSHSSTTHQNNQHTNEINNRPTVTSINSNNFGGRPNSNGNSQNNQVYPGTSTGPKKVCTFVQSGGIGGGKKICTSAQSNGVPFTSNEDLSQGQGNQNSLEMFGGRSFNTFGNRFGRSLGFRHPPQHGILTNHFSILSNGKQIKHTESALRSKRDMYSDIEKSPLFAVRGSSVASRAKRALLHHASPSNVFDSRLLSCRAGASRDINAKCRDTILPSRKPKRRGVRAAPPVPPTPSCPTGMAYNIWRMCVPATNAQNTIIAYNLG